VRQSRTVLRDRWLHLQADTVEDARGNLLDPYYTLHGPNWVSVAALTDDDRLVLVRQYRHGLVAPSLELPAGAIDPGDADPVAAGQRELLEETGHAAREWRLVSSLSPNTALHRNTSHTVLALGAHRVAEPALEPGEDITVELHPWRDVVAGLRSGVLPQAMHVAGLLIALEAAGRLRFEAI